MYQVDNWDNELVKFVLVLETESYLDAFERFRYLSKKSELSSQSQAIRLLIKNPREVIKWWTNRLNEFN